MVCSIYNEKRVHVRAWNGTKMSIVFSNCENNNLEWVHQVREILFYDTKIKPTSSSRQKHPLEDMYIFVGVTLLLIRYHWITVSSERYFTWILEMTMQQWSSLTETILAWATKLSLSKLSTSFMNVIMSLSDKATKLLQWQHNQEPASIGWHDLQKKFTALLRFDKRKSTAKFVLIVTIQLE